MFKINLESIMGIVVEVLATSAIIGLQVLVAYIVFILF